MGENYKRYNEELQITTPEIYFGNLTKDYIITNTSEKEFNYPMENENAETTYSGDGGIKLNLLNRIAFSIDNRTPKILISGAITSSTLTTACVFLPIVFIKGITRQLFADMGLTIAYSLLASLLVALTLVPAMASAMLKKTNKD